MSRFSSPFGRPRSAVQWLLIANGLVFLLQQFLPGWFELQFGLVPSQVVGRFHVWQLGTYLFLHGSLFHLLMNLFTLWMFGKELEALWGTKEFLKY